jgi:hypothetical protein
VVFFLITPIMFVINICLLFKRRWPNANALIILSSNTLFLGYFCITGAIEGHFVQAFLVGSFFLIPFQVVSLLLASFLGAKLDRLLHRHVKVT